MTALFHHILYDCWEDYVDIVVNSKEVQKNVNDLKEPERCKQYLE